MPVQLRPQTERRIDEYIRSGHFASGDDVVAAGVRMLDERDATLASVREKIRFGVDQASRGEVKDGNAVFASLLAGLSVRTDE